MWTAGQLVFATDMQRPWMASHGCTPTPLVLEDRFRVLFAPRDAEGRSIPSYVDLALDDPKQILGIGERPIMELGALGTFDDGGIMPCCVVRSGAAIYLYYVGWNASVSVPYRNAIGVAVSTDDGRSFERLFPGAIVDRTREEPFFTASPFVLRQGDAWHLWYASTIRFELVNGRAEPVYVLRHATSHNGLDWERDGRDIMPPRHQSEAQARPCVIIRGGVWHMWFCHRDNTDFRDGEGSYRIGHARSADGERWERVDDDAGPPRSSDVPDTRMQAYPAVVEHGGRLHLFYNGDGFGRAGFAYARQRL